MKNENVFMSRKKRYGEHPKASRLRPLRDTDNQLTPRPSKMDRHDQSLKARDIGNAWWETMPKYWRRA